MFSSNQIFEMSGSLSSMEQLKAAFEFALLYSGNADKIRQEKDRDFKILYQITPDGKYCIGWGNENTVPKGWTEYPSEFNVDNICKDIKSHLEGFPFEEGMAEGAYDRGFIMKCINEYMGCEYDGIKNPFYGIVYFQQFTCYYSR